MTSKSRFEFATLEDAARVCGQMANEIEAQHALIVGMQTMVLALMATHHDHDHMQLSTTRYLEHILGTSSKAMLSDEQRTKVRDFVEQVQQKLKPMPPIPAGMPRSRPPAG